MLLDESQMEGEGVCVWSGGGGESGERLTREFTYIYAQPMETQTIVC